MKEFGLGSKVSHPIHGAGVVVNIEARSIGGALTSYYIVDLLMKNMRVCIPVDKAGDIGLRGIAPRNTVTRVFRIMAEGPNRLVRKWNARYQLNWDKIKTGDISKVAEVWRDLAWRHKEKGLSIIEKKMFNEVQDLLISELAFAMNVRRGEAEALITNVYREKVGITTNGA